MLQREDILRHTLNDWLDEDGRPLGEQAAPQGYAPVRDEVACPFSDRRAGLPMNRGALRQIQRCWPEVRALVRSLSVPSATVQQAWRVSVATTIAPLLLPRPTPRLFSALYKTTIGFNQILAFLLLGDDGVADLPLAALAAPDDFLRWLDQEGWLLGTTQACAGPPHLIAALFADLCGEGASSEAPGWSTLPGWAEATTQAMRWQAEALADAIAARGRDPLEGSAAPWLTVASLRPEQRPEDVRRLLPAAQR